MLVVPGLGVTRKDPLRVLEAAYTFEGDEATWLRRIADAAAPYGLGLGVGLATADLGLRAGLRCLALERTPFDPHAVAAASRVIPDSVFRRVWAPSPTVSSEAAMLAALEAEGMEMEPSKLDEVAAPGWGAIGGDATAETVLLWLPAQRGSTLPRAHRAALDAMGAHLGAALRLRSLVSGAPSRDDHAIEAVISPAGKVLDARGAGQGALGTLVEAAKRTERARSRKATPDERLALWTALFDGQWSIVESTERDGKRMLLACRNEPRTVPLRRLSTRERSVASYAALGHSVKYMAYELGLSASCVSITLKAALLKLGLKSRAELIRALGALDGRGHSLPPPAAT